jgi:hypothetical protein
MNTISADCSQVTLDVIRCKLFYLRSFVKKIKLKIYGTINWLVLCGHENYSFKLREERRIKGVRE